MTALVDLPLAEVLLASLRRMFPAGVAVGLARIGEHATNPMFHVKHSATDRMVPARRQEFLAGRLAAERAQAALGFAPRPVLAGQDRAPIWPARLTGSISHASGVAMAVVARNDAVLALGVDIERRLPLAPEIAETVLLPEEAGFLKHDADGSLLFSAKEAVYKALYPLSPEVAGYDLLAIHPDPTADRFTARLTRRYGPLAEGSEIAGRYALAGGLILTAVTLHHNRRAAALPAHRPVARHAVRR